MVAAIEFQKEPILLLSKSQQSVCVWTESSVRTCRRTTPLEQLAASWMGACGMGEGDRQGLSSKSAPGISGIPFKGVFFSTFFGVHETSWGPKKEVHAYFSNFKVSTTKL
jgi:hypothetical protein